MLTVRIIACLDVADGQVVKGVQFQNLRQMGDPAELALAYEQQGADEIVLLDVSATPQQRKTGIETVRRVRGNLSIPLTVGGGVRSVVDATALLEGGADKIAINSAAVEQPEIITQLSEQFGQQCIVLAIDAKRTHADQWQVMTHSGQRNNKMRADEWAARGESLGAGEVLLTSWDRDGTAQGYDLQLIRQIRQTVQVPVIASGGASSVEHLIEASRAGADAVLAASIFHDNQYTVQKVKTIMAEQGFEVRV